MRYLYFVRDDEGYKYCSTKMKIEKRYILFKVRNKTDEAFIIHGKTFERATKRKLKVGEQIRIPEKEFAKLFKNAEVVE